MSVVNGGFKRGEVVLVWSGGTGKSALLEAWRKSLANLEVATLEIGKLEIAPERLSICPTETHVIAYDRFARDLKEPAKNQPHGPIVKRGKGKVKKW